eukprot:TRINITY_DN412_c0_g1_i2.p1 TRINITY_DN412_c0_g1~~TRINITY_DN412_c0_g1_i2.p1  ORF type:complete len:579 (+),score=131.90 TRINITY_DN412_c0_g1_i2:25-1761(+)
MADGIDPDALLEEAMNELEYKAGSETPRAASESTTTAAPAAASSAREISVLHPADEPESYSSPEPLWWTQNEQNVEIHVPIPQDVKSKELKVTILPGAIKVVARGEVVADWELAEQVIPGDEAEWDIAERQKGKKAVRLELPKKVPKRIWDYVITRPFDRKDLLVTEEQLKALRAEDDAQKAAAKQEKPAENTAAEPVSDAGPAEPAKTEPAAEPAEAEAPQTEAPAASEETENKEEKVPESKQDPNQSEEPYEGEFGEGLDDETEEETEADKALSGDDLLTEGWKALERSNYAEGIHYLRVGALHRGSIECIFSLIKLYQKPSGGGGIPGVNGGPHRVLWLLFHGAKIGNKDLACQLGKCYEVGALTVVPSLPSALRWYQKAAVAGEGTALVRLARLHMTGGCDKTDPLVKQRSNPEKARAIMDEAMSRGVLEAQRLQLHWYIEGRPLYPRNVEKMEEFWQRLHTGHPGFLDLQDLVAKQRMLNEEQAAKAPANPEAASPTASQSTAKSGALQAVKKSRVQFSEQAQRFNAAYGDEDIVAAPKRRGGSVWFGVKFWENVGTAAALAAVGAFLWHHRQ